MEYEELIRLRSLCNAATDGPWVAGVRKQVSASQYESHAIVIGPEYVYADRDKNFCEPDGIFIAESRNAMPLLIDEVLRLRAEFEDLERENTALISTLSSVTGEN